MGWVDTVIHVKHAMSDYAQGANPTYGLLTTQMAWGGWTPVPAVATAPVRYAG
jgi:hypothetical protein